MVRPETCTDRAGESPVRVSAGRPGSRRQPGWETAPAERCVTSLPVGVSEAAGRNKVNASASPVYQSKGVRERRASHVGAKAKHGVLVPDRTLSGVGTRSRCEGSGRKRYIRKQRPLEHPTVQDRAAQMAVKLVIEPRFEPYFRHTDEHVHERLGRWLGRRLGQRTRRRGDRTLDRLHEMGSYRLHGTLCYPAQATPRRSSVSREIRTRDLKGGPGMRLA